MNMNKHRQTLCSSTGSHVLTWQRTHIFRKQERWSFIPFVLHKLKEEMQTTFDPPSTQNHFSWYQPVYIS
jgi:hypothetical protein